MAYTFKKLPTGLVEVYQDNKRISTGTESAAKTYGYGTEPVAPITPTPVAQAAPVQQPQPKVLPQEFYTAARSAIETGAFSPQQALNYLQGIAGQGGYAAPQTNLLYAPGLNIKTPEGRIADFQPDLSGTTYFKTPEVKTSATNIYGEQTKPQIPKSVFEIPSVQDYLRAVGRTQGLPESFVADVGELQGVAESAFGASGKPKNLQEYFSAIGQSLPSIDARGQLYEQLGLGSATSYAGTVEQNQALLNSLNQGGARAGAVAAVGQAGAPTGVPATGAVSTAGLSGISATDTLKTLGITTPSESDLFDKVMASPEFKLFQEAIGLKTSTAEANAAAAKDVLEAKYEQDKNILEQKLAENGLAFSGIRGAQVKALSDSLAASKLGEDRKLASALLDADIDLRTRVISDVAKLIKDSFDQKKEALDQLNKAGYALIGTTLVPTAEALRIAQSADNEDFDRMIALKRLEISYQLAGTASERNSILNQIREVTLAEKTAVTPGQYVNAATNLPVKLTEEARQMLQRSETIIDYYTPTLLEMLKGVESGAIAGRIAKYTVGTPIAQYFRDEDMSMFNAMSAYFSQQIVYMNSGKQINPEEMKRLYQSLPDVTFSVSENKKRIEQFNRITKESYNRYLTGNGMKKYTGQATYSGYSPNIDLTPALVGAEGIDLSDLDFTF